MSFNAFSRVTPGYTLPGAIHDIVKPSQAFNALPNREPTVQIDQDTLIVYAKKISYKQNAQRGLNPTNVLPTPGFRTSLIQVPAYVVRNAAQWDNNESMMSAHWDIPLPEMNRALCHQAINQTMRDALLFGVTPSNGEGIVNGAGTTTPWAADADGNTTLQTMNNAWLFQQFLNVIAGIKSRIGQSMEGNPRVTITSSYRVINALASKVVPLTSNQIAGGGTATVVDSVRGIGQGTVEWLVDDTLSAAGTNGADIILVSVPSMLSEELEGSGRFSVSATNSVGPRIDETMNQYVAGAAPIESIIPQPQFRTHATYQQRLTPGWVLRPEAITKIEVKF